MKRFSCARFLGLAFAAAVLPLMVVMACGPDWEPEVFVPEHHPENPARFAEGQLGVLQPGYYHAELVVAYRYLHGGKLSDAEKAVYTGSPPSSYTPENWQAQHAAEEAAKPNNRWASARGAFDVDGVKGSVVPEERTIERKEGNYTFKDFELNCTDGAFENATATLGTRAKTWGAASAELKEWIRGQDAVFSNCEKVSAMPAAAKAEWPALLRQDRAYQIAAADFYAGNFEDAVKGFEAIGRNTASPWSKWGEYLAARAEVRKASSTVKAATWGERATFDLELLKAAQTRLQRLQQQTKDPAIRHAAEDELGFIQVRLDPSARLDAVSVALAGPGPDPDFKNHVTDLDFLLDHVAKDSPQSNADLVRWIHAMQSGSAKDSNDLTNLPWLVATLSAVQKDSAQVPQLLAAAAKVPPGSPAYVTVAFHRARLLMASGKTADARALTTALLAGLPKDDSGTRNALLEQRMPTAKTLDDFLADAPRTIIGDATSQAASMVQCPASGASACKENKIQPMQFDTDSAAYLNLHMPLATLEQAAESTALPVHLRQAVAMQAWVRALGLGDVASVKRMAKLLPAPMRQTAGESDGFPATLALLRAPGARPFLGSGVQRSISYAELDHFRDNWWCGRWSDGSPPPGSQTEGPQLKVLPPLGLLTATLQRQATDEAARLNALPPGLVWVGQRAMEYVKAHPQDKDAPETLALIVHGTRYGCGEYNDPKPQSALSKQAFEMLHRMYPTSPWSAKTKYYY